MLKFQMSETKQFRKFEFWKFEFALDFDIRISDFLTPEAICSGYAGLGYEYPAA